MKMFLNIALVKHLCTSGAKCKDHIGILATGDIHQVKIFLGAENGVQHFLLFIRYFVWSSTQLIGVYKDVRVFWLFFNLLYHHRRHVVTLVGITHKQPVYSL